MMCIIWSKINMSEHTAVPKVEWKEPLKLSLEISDWSMQSLPLLFVSCQLHYYLLTMKQPPFWVQLLRLVLTFMLFVGRIWKSYRDQDEEDKQRPGNFNQQLKLETIKKILRHHIQNTGQKRVSRTIHLLVRTVVQVLPHFTLPMHSRTKKFVPLASEDNLQRITDFSHWYVPAMGLNWMCLRAISGFL